MGNRTLLAAFVFAVLLAGSAAYWVHGSGHKTEESGLSCAAGESLQVFVDVYYPGELRPGDYIMIDDRITLNFQEVSSGELQVNRANFTLPCVPRDVIPKLFEIRVGERVFSPSCEGLITTPVPSGGNGTSLSIYYIASPYNLSEVALIVPPEGYSFEGLKLENGTLMLFISPEAGTVVLS